eukprot:3785648-Pleurochrysis_carterae.AAC.1
MREMREPSANGRLDELPLPLGIRMQFCQGRFSFWSVLEHLVARALGKKCARLRGLAHMQANNAFHVLANNELVHAVTVLACCVTAKWVHARRDPAFDVPETRELPD